ncbi:histidinol-phosphate aminotransferase [Herbinix hemicellulosilytica]|uniref:Histidinol-phosphate aminotransferase n=1 Tax=Herbinix hemicellulosilytica TaxID=1564487 RepID=A0A0H5SD58_HERHM|nr:histidinol-phosphate transaminase [Herbinix hemicellulosilytica]RBP57808.1 histidinol-phosphate aminotransferase [Herbinix hemicellulosilytica]CRZ33359.1 Histidinol-phosphate aminotransferase [Herbinix hemicellulosilytica]
MSEENVRAWEKYIRRVKPYVPGEQTKDKSVIKLNTNENPFPPAPGVLEALKNMDADNLRMYPDPSIGLLVEELAKFYGVDKEEVFVGVGSDDVLAMAFMTFFNSEKPILFPDITYTFYPVWCDLYRIPYETQAVDSHFRIVKEDYYKDNGGVVIANPNAPTSIYEDISTIEDIVIHNPDSVVIVDEAYIDFAKESAIPLTKKYDNLLVVQTFSKSRAMAGMRIGFAIGSKRLIKALNDVKYSFNSYTLSQAAILAGVEAVKDGDYFRDSIEKVIKIREDAAEKFKELGFSFPKSSTNFLFVTHEFIPAKELFNALRENKILVRYFDLPRINNYLRISIGTKEQMDILFGFLRKYINKKKNIK